MNRYVVETFWEVSPEYLEKTEAYVDIAKKHYRSLSHISPLEWIVEHSIAHHFSVETYPCPHGDYAEGQRVVVVLNIPSEDDAFHLRLMCGSLPANDSIALDNGSDLRTYRL